MQPLAVDGQLSTVNGRRSLYLQPGNEMNEKMIEIEDASKTGSTSLRVTN